MKKIILSILTLMVFAIFLGCSSESPQTRGVAKAPSGNNCAENVAYLQDGVNKYKEALGAIPIDVNALVEQKDGKGPFVEKVPPCPSGNLYKIDPNGQVFESPRQ